MLASDISKGSGAMAKATWKNRIMGWLLAGLQTALLVSAMQSHFNMQALRKIGATVDMATLIDVILYDMIYFGPVIMIVILVGFLIAFPIAALLQPRVPAFLANHAYGLAGAGAMVTILLLMPKMMDITPIAAARTSYGFFALCMAGLLGGGSFTKFLRKKAAQAG